MQTSVDYWLRMIHLYTAENSKTGDSSLSPPVFIVGTHRNQLADDEIKRTKIVSKVLEKKSHRSRFKWEKLRREKYN